MMLARRPVVWIGTAKADFIKFPDEVQDDFGYQLWLVENGELPRHAKPLKGFGGASVVELVEQFNGSAYRAVYTTRIRGRTCILHCIEKKSSNGIKTSRRDLTLIRQRLAQAESEYGS